MYPDSDKKEIGSSLAVCGEDILYYTNWTDLLGLCCSTSSSYMVGCQTHGFMKTLRVVWSLFRLSGDNNFYCRISKVTKETRTNKRDWFSNSITDPVSCCVLSMSLYNGFNRELMTLSFISRRIAQSLRFCSRHAAAKPTAT